MLTDTEVELFVDFRVDLIGINDEEAEGADTVELFEFGVRVVDGFGGGNATESAEHIKVDISGEFTFDDTIVRVECTMVSGCVSMLAVDFTK